MSVKMASICFTAKLGSGFRCNVVNHIKFSLRISFKSLSFDVTPTLHETII